MHPQTILTTPGARSRSPFNSDLWNRYYANWLNGDQAMQATLIDSAGTALLGLNPAATSSVTLHGTAVTVQASGMTVTVPASFTGNVTLGDAAGDTITVNGALTAEATAILKGNVTIGDANTDAHTVIGTTTFRNAAASATQLVVDATNNRVLVATGTALGSTTAPNLQVAGRLYVAPESAADLAVQLRRSAAATVGWSIGVESTNDLIFKDDADTSIVRIGDAASTYQLDVLAGDFHVFDDAVIGGDISATRGVFGATTFSGLEELRVVGQSQLEGEVTVSSGGVTVSAGAVTVANNQSYRSVETDGTTFRNLLKIDGSNVVQMIGATSGWVLDSADIQLKYAGTTRIRIDANGIGIFGATPVARPAAYTQTYATATRTHSNLTATALTALFGTSDGTVDDVGASFNSTILNNNFQECVTRIGQLINDVANVKQVVNQILDDFQSRGDLQ